MKSRNREVNIFNMSLLDILCGALGAFCFMMLVLFPYWKPKGATAEDVEKRYQQMNREMQDLKKELDKVPGGGGDLKNRVDRLNNQVQEQRRQLDQARQEAEKAKKENGELKVRRPMTISMNWSSAQHDVDLYVRWRGKTSNGQEQPQPDTTKKQSFFFTGDTLTDCILGPCSDTWMVRDMPTPSEYEIHYKFVDAKGNPAPAKVDKVFVNHQGGFFILPSVEMAQPKTSVFVGVISIDPDLKLTFKPQPEYAAQFQQMNKPPDPTPQQQPIPAPSPK